MRKNKSLFVRMVCVTLVAGTFIFALGLGYIIPNTNTVTVSMQPDVIVEILDPSLTQYTEVWRIEVGRRFHNAVGIIVHGGDFVEGEWVVGAGLGGHISKAGDIARHYQTLYRGRTVVFISCNPGHLKINVPGVYYASDSIWSLPDRALTPMNMMQSRRLLDDVWEYLLEVGDKSRWEQNPTVIGNIFEFVTD